jgi:hypothetical protein
METVLALFEQFGVITMIVGVVGGLLTLGIVKLRAYVANSETKIDDEILDIVDKAVEDSKKDTKE